MTTLKKVEDIFDRWKAGAAPTREEALLAQEALFPRKLKRVYEDTETPTSEWEETPVTLPDICIQVRAALTGASDPLPEAFLARVTAMLTARVTTWIHTDDPFDVAVYLMVVLVKGVLIKREP